MILMIIMIIPNVEAIKGQREGSSVSAIPPTTQMPYPVLVYSVSLEFDLGGSGSQLP